MRGTKRALLCAVFLCAGYALAGCSTLLAPGEKTAAAPNLGLLEMTPYVDADAPTAAETGESPAYVRVDLWLDASQLMGGINAHEESIFPHNGRRYREGGFHYRLGNKVGWYENVLMDMLGAAEGSRVRVLRVGNERLPDSYLAAQGLVSANASPDAFASMRRDLLTYAIDPLPSLFAELSAEDMAGSFYALGSPKLNQMERFAQEGGAGLENPGKAERMNSALEAQIAAIAEGGAAARSLVAQSGREDNDCPLMYALDNLDLSRLNVITFDPIGLRRLSGTDAEGRPAFYVEEMLKKRGVFDQGLCVGLYAMRLDYVGQIMSVGPADLAEPLIWGKPTLDSKKNVVSGMAAMPRTLLALVIGRQEQVDGYMGKLTARLNADTALQGLRGPEKGELTYSQGGVTVAQQPFAFALWETKISRPNAGYYTQHMEDSSLTVERGAGKIEESTAPLTVSLAPDGTGKHENRVLRLSFPLKDAEDGAKLDLSDLSDAHVEVMVSLLLTETLPSSIDDRREPMENEQIVALRDQLYVYAHRVEPFADNEGESPFSLMSLGQNDEGTELSCTVAVNGGKLKEGYYRVRVCADITSRAVEWLPVNWIDGEDTLSASVKNEDISRWEGFAAKIAEKERGKKAIPKSFQHAWGPYTERKYNGLTVPDCPPVYKAVGLGELVGQFREAAKAEQSPYVRYVFDVFVDNVGAPGP